MEPDNPSPPPPPPQQQQKAETLFGLASGPLALAAAKVSVRSAAIPSGRDFHFYHNFDRFRTPVKEITAKSESLLRSIGSSSGSLLPAGADLDENYDWLVNLNDDIFEKFAVSMDEFRVLREKEEEEKGAKIASMGLDSGFQMVYGKKKKKKSGENGDDKLVSEEGGNLAVKVASRDMKTMAPRSRVPFHIPSIPRPQDEFNIRVNNSNQPFEHVWLERGEDGSRFVHPLENLSVLDFVDGNIGEGEPVKPLPVENTPFKLVEEVKELKELAFKLRDVNEFAVDLEHNQYRSFQGMTCLMQISTRTEDFIVDTLKLRIHVGPHLREAFKDPSKRKVMHGADRDILWLQRDFGIYVCNLFDTGQASRVMLLERNSLEFLLHHFCGVTANKEYQNADWRLRPLPDEMLKYAREDTHYLLYIYDVMRRRLLSQSFESGNGDSLLVEVYKRSCDICMQLYEKDLLTDTSYQYIYGLHEADLNSQQLAVVAGLCKWRDNVARAEDESTGYILPNKALLEIARQMPLSSSNLRRLVRFKHPFVEQQLSSVINIIRSSVENAAAFESICEQLRKGRGEAVPEQHMETTIDHSESLLVIEDPTSGTTVSQMEILDGSDSVQKTGQVDVSMGYKDDDLKPPTTEHGGDQTSPVSHSLSVSSSDIAPSVQLSAGAKIIVEGKMDGGIDLPSQSAKAVNVVSVQMLKKPTGAFGALIGSSSSKRKFDLDHKGRSVERDKAEIKLEKIKSSVTLPFHSFSGGVDDLRDRPVEAIIPCNSHHPESLVHQENKSAETAKPEEIIPLENESYISHPSSKAEVNNDPKHKEWFPQHEENGGAEDSAVDMETMEESMSISDISSNFQKCLQSTNQTQRPKENQRTSQDPDRYFLLQPFDYAAARKQVNFGDNRGREAGAEGDDTLRGRHKGSELGQGHEDRVRDFQPPRRRQAFPASGNRSATFH